MLEVSGDEVWRGTGDPIMAVKLARAVWGDTAPARFQVAMWRMLDELELATSVWADLFESCRFLGPNAPASPGRKRQQTPAQLLQAIQSALRGLAWHESIPLRLLQWAVADDFTRFHHEVNDTHLKAHFCDIIRDGLAPTGFDGPALATHFPRMVELARQIQQDRAYEEMALLADQWESLDGVHSDHPLAAMIQAAVDHARQAGHGPGCWLLRELTEIAPSPLPKSSIERLG